MIGISKEMLLVMFQKMLMENDFEAGK